MQDAGAQALGWRNIELSDIQHFELTSPSILISELRSSRTQADLRNGHAASPVGQYGHRRAALDRLHARSQYR